MPLSKPISVLKSLLYPVQVRHLEVSNYKILTVTVHIDVTQIMSLLGQV
jgi:hypothetical protein